MIYKQSRTFVYEIDTKNPYKLLGDEDPSRIVNKPGYVALWPKSTYTIQRKIYTKRP